MVAFSPGYDLTTSTWAVSTPEAMQIKTIIVLNISISISVHKGNSLF